MAISFGMILQNVRGRVIICALLLSAVALVLHFFISIPALRFTGFDGSSFRISDFFYHYYMVCAWWRGAIESIYLVESQRSVMAANFGVEVATVMPVGMGPVLLLLFAPLVPFSAGTPEIALTIWLTISLGIFAIGLHRLCLSLPGHSHGNFYWILIVVMLIASSQAMLKSLWLGQTSLFAFGLLALALTDGERSGSPLRYCLYIGLGIKPTYAALAWVCLFGMGKIRRSTELLAVNVVLVLVCSVMLDATLPGSWFKQLAVYSSLPIPLIYEHSLNLSISSNIRTWMGGVDGLVASKVMLALFVGAVVATGLAVRQQKIGRDLTQIACAAWLLILPYAGSYEDILLGLVALMRVRAVRGHGIIKAAFIVVSAFALNSSLFMSLTSLPVVLIGKSLFLFGLMIWILKENVTREDSLSVA